MVLKVFYLRMNEVIYHVYPDQIRQTVNQKPNSSFSQRTLNGRKKSSGRWGTMPGTWLPSSFSTTPSTDWGRAGPRRSKTTSSSWTSTGRGYSDRRRSLFLTWRVMRTPATLTVSCYMWELDGSTGYFDRKLILTVSWLFDCKLTDS